MKELSSTPRGFSLEQNYPNPFNPTTTIRFSVPTSGNVLLHVYDVLGQEVATLVNETMQPGAYEITWNATNSPSGIYLYRLQAGTLNATRKMILAK